MPCHFSLRSTTRLNEMKNLFNQILRNAQDDTMIGNFYFDTASLYKRMQYIVSCPFS